MIKMYKQIADFIEDVTDNVISISVFGAAIYCVLMSIIVPEYFSVILGMIAVHYFQKKSN